MHFFVALSVVIAILAGVLHRRVSCVDFVSSSIDINTDVQQTLNNFYEGLRYCGPSSGGSIFVTLHGVPECALLRTDGSAMCDLYSAGMYGGRSDWVLGRVEFSPSETGTFATFKVLTYAANKTKIV